MAKKEKSNTSENRYLLVMRKLFEEKFTGAEGFEWDRKDIYRISRELGIDPIKNPGDNVYSIRHGRLELPQEINSLIPSDRAWLLLPNGKSGYRFIVADRSVIDIDRAKKAIKIPDSTPQIVARYAKEDEQAVLARIRYCRLVDIFMRLASFQLQSHMRTTVAHFKGAQTELDEIYLGVDANGAQFVIPIQAKGHDERIGVVQVVTDHYACVEKFPQMIPRTLLAKTVKIEESPVFGRIFTIALIEACVDDGYNVHKLREEHFEIVPASRIDENDLRAYRIRFQQEPRGTPCA
jgi:hypothetical protein